MATEIHKVLFPKVLYPFHSIMLTMSIFMTVGISLERYTAVHQPVDYNQVCIYREIFMKSGFIDFLSFLYPGYE